MLYLDTFQLLYITVIFVLNTKNKYYVLILYIYLYMMNNLVNNQNMNFNNILHFYLWVSQGENVSSNHNYYPIETKFAALTFYSQPFEKANEQFLLNLEKLTFISKMRGLYV